MTRLSVNINKIATLRNARGGVVPDLLKAARDCESYGAQGITVHPRPDERHIRYQDVRDLSLLVVNEFNIEGYPSDDFLDLVESVDAQQVTLVPDPPDALTSNAGWDCVGKAFVLRPIIDRLKARGMRVSVFLEAEPEQVKAAHDLGADRIELYTESYAAGYAKDRMAAVRPFLEAAEEAQKIGIGLNAGHDLDLNNLRYFAGTLPDLLEVSIGHALISDALYFGLENSIRMYLRELELAEVMGAA